ncbi:hypothetical protein [Mycoplasmopsis iners]|uniref:hypothetical protein n=1 Tax=Mycoplasmopsis iners TaxID=76630 RepID=UPI000497666F|nr:hypothetical protein [Mycoplasmopsis iners]
MSETVKEYWNFASNPSHFWIPLIVFGFFSIFSLLIGLKRGWIPSLISLGFNFLALVISVLATIPLIKVVEGFSTDKDVTLLLAKTHKIDPLLRGIWILSFTFGLMCIFKLIYWIVIHRFIKKRYKAKGKPKVLSRLLGAGISVVGIMPLTVLSTNLTGAANYANGFIKFNDAMLYGMTFGTSKGMSKYMPGIRGTANLVTEEKIADGAERIFEQFTKQESYAKPDVNTIAAALLNPGSKVNFEFTPFLTSNPTDDYADVKVALSNFEYYAESIESTNILEFALNVALTESSDSENFKTRFKNQVKLFASALEATGLDLSQINLVYRSNDQDKTRPNIALKMFTGEKRESLKQSLLESLGYKDVKVPSNNEKLAGKTDEEKYMYVLNMIVNNVILSQD